jgi:15-cis-phytoene synthase
MLPVWIDSEAADLAVCRALLRGGSRTFDAAARLLPKSVREPAVALYAFCRVADDAIDGGGGIAELRNRLALAYAGRPAPYPTDRAFARLVQQQDLPRTLPEALLEGFAWDAEGRRYDDLPTLRAYAVRVAGSVGVMMAMLMGVRDPGHLATAVELGVAMQFSNIARDVGEDAHNGRLYLPLAWLAEAGIDPDRFLACPRHSPALGQVIERLLDAARSHYRHALVGIARLPPGCRLGVGAACLLYAEIGQEVTRRGLDAVSGRAVVSGRRKAWVLALGLIRLASPPQPLVDRPMPEGTFLVEAVAEAQNGTDDRPPPWWHLLESVSWLIDLLARMEQRERSRILHAR